ncbi:hypothetical protein ADIS_1720 [Lunatimonas lonarensis]|uniref:Uncharacterized protein n=1 Tax=Lunatimonas lonarensis TaxID=1232681 RepID=R7ZUG8_9BACT|nr:hypothetical protein ADIS_1720 [Lunatimonas lonarensis]
MKNPGRAGVFVFSVLPHFSSHLGVESATPYYLLPPLPS